MNGDGDEEADECHEFYHDDGRGSYREAENLEDGCCGDASFHHSHADALGRERRYVTGDEDFHRLVPSDDEAVRDDEREEDDNEEIPREGDDHVSMLPVFHHVCQRQ